MDMQIFATLPASDIDRARSWYSERLGLEPVDSSPDGGLFYDVGGSMVLLYPSAFAGTNQATAAGMVVKDFDAAAAMLRANGVEFEDYDFGEEFRTVDGVLTAPDGAKGAWFQDSEGNILGLTEDTRS
ncbi:MAG: VOC family protein [Acidimicrobiia bacterium]|nr:VOC family protein [Acidimicrobiia bacterium]